MSGAEFQSGKLELLAFLKMSHVLGAPQRGFLRDSHRLLAKASSSRRSRLSFDQRSRSCPLPVAAPRLAGDIGPAPLLAADHGQYRTGPASLRQVVRLDTIAL